MVSATEGLLAGRYEMHDTIGTGGMGTVVRARDNVLQRTVAVKLLKDSLASDDNARERLRREARTAAGIAHPNIAQIFDYGEDEGKSYIVMEFLEGSDLHTRVRREGPLDPIEAATIVAQVADALQHAHAAGAVHRDVKPGNIFLTLNGEVKLTDFGIARSAGATTMTATGSVMGTYLYLSPEQIDGETANHASDIYSLGCVLYETLAGKPPYESDTPMAVAMAHLSKPVPEVREVNPEVPVAISEIVQKAMAKNPGERFQTAEEMAEALRQATGAVPTGPMPSPALETQPESPRDAAAAIAAMPPEAKTSLPEDVEQSQRAASPTRRRRPWIVVALLLAIIAAVLLLALLTRKDPVVAAPRLVGLQIEEAQEKANALGLKLRPAPLASREPEGKVLTQNPSAGIELSEGAVVEVTVSNGQIEVPGVTGLSLGEARDILRNAGFQVAISGNDEGDPTVTGQDPVGGANASPGSVVTLIVSENGERGERGKGKKEEGDD